MSYRIQVEGKQLFGNGECPKKWIDFIKSQGIEVNEDDCYEGEITNFMDCLNTVEDIVMDKSKNITYDRYSQNGLFDLSYILKAIENNESSLLYSLQNLVNNGYLFLPYALYEICKNKLEVTYIHDKETDSLKRIYKIKDGEKITTQAY